MLLWELLHNMESSAKHSFLGSRRSIVQKVDWLVLTLQQKETPLALACRIGHTDAAKVLVEDSRTNLNAKVSISVFLSSCLTLSPS